MGETTDRSGTLAAAVTALWLRFRPVILERLDQLDAAAVAAVDGSLKTAERSKARRTAHGLAGSLGTYGFPEGSRIAAQIEVLLEGKEALAEADRLRFCDLVVLLRTELERETAAAGNVDDAAEPEGDGPLVLALLKDRELAERAEFEAASRRIRLQRVGGMRGARKKDQTRPAGLILDLGAADEPADVIALLEQPAWKGVPAVIIGADDTFAERVAAARGGALAFCPRKSAVSAILDVLEPALHAATLAGARVLVVDDDPLIIAFVEDLLGSRGMSVVGETNPTQFWTLLRRTAPDLVILDFDMPELNGLELCRVLRADAQWHSLPVVFITGRPDEQATHAAFDAGGDDFVTKAAIPTELVTRVENRLVRSSRSLRGPAVHDRRVIEQDVERLLHIAGRMERPVSIARVRLAELETLKERFGQVATTEITARVASHVQGRIEQGDVIGAVGPHELLVALFDTTPAETAQLLRDVNRVVSAEVIKAPEGDVRISFHAAVAGYPADGRRLGDLLATIDRTLAHELAGDVVISSAEQRATATECVDVVIVEDDDVVSELLAHALRLQGYSICQIADGDDAVARLAGDTPLIDARVILLDVDLNGLDGLTVLRELKKSAVTEHSNVMMLTARSTEREVLMALELGAVDHVAKPFSMPVLLQRVRALLKNG